MTKAPDKLISHKRGCVTCFKADMLSQLCRIGRRLYIAWFKNLNEEQQVMALFDMPKEMQDDVKKYVDIEHIHMGDVVLPAKN